MQPDSRHVVLFLAAPNIFLPVRKLGIYRSEGHEHALTEGATVLHEPGIYAGDVLMENPIETPCPSLPDVLLPQPGNQFGRLVRYQTPKGPTGQTHVRVDYHNRYPFLCRPIAADFEPGVLQDRRLHRDRLLDDRIQLGSVAALVGLQLSNADHGAVSHTAIELL